LLYTDGLTEARSPDGELFEIERLGRVFGDAGSHPVELLDAVRGAAHAWTEGARLDDDLTLVVVTRS